MTDAMSARLREALSIREGEGVRTFLLFLALLLASSVFILGRTVRDTLFLSRYPVSWLPWMFVFYGIASAVTVVLYSLIADRWPRHRIIAFSTLFGAVTYVATYVAVKAHLYFIYPTFYVWSEVAANLFIVQIWTFANDLTDARAARRLFPTVAAARILGVVLIGLVTGVIVSWIGTEQLLLVLVGMILAIGAIALRLGREPLAPHPPTRGRPKPKILDNRYVQAISLLLLVAFTALTIGDYQFKMIARETYREDDLTRFFSLFYATVGTISFVFQIFITPRILDRFGVGPAMRVMPAVFGMANVALLFIPKLGIAAVEKFSDNGFQYTIHETTLQALYAPFAEEVKARTRAFLDAVVKPMSYGVGGLVLVFVATHVSVISLSYINLGLVAVWLVSVSLVRKRYLRALEETLGSRGAIAYHDLATLDASGRGLLLHLLDGENARITELALERLDVEASPLIVRAVERLTSHAQASVRAAALRRLAELPHANPAGALNAVHDPSTPVRAAALRAVGKLCGDRELEILVAALEDPKQKPRVQALAALLRDAGIEGSIAGGARMAALLESPDRKRRIEAGRVLSQLDQGAFRAIRRLLEDEDAKVRRSALRAAEHVPDARLVPFLIDALHAPRTSARAGRALAALGLGAVEPLLELLGDRSASRHVRLEVPRILRRIDAAPEIFTALLPYAKVDDPQVRLRVLGTLARVRDELALPPLTLADIQRRVEAELSEAYALLAGWNRAKATYSTPLMDESMGLRQKRAGERILRILELRYPRAPLHLVRRALGRPSRRANAMELLDGMMEPSLRAKVLPFFDDRSLDALLASAQVEFTHAPEPLEFMLGQCRHPKPFAVAAALDALTLHPGPKVVAAAFGRWDHPSRLVRETALVVAAKMDPQRTRERLADRPVDKDEIVAARVALIIQAKENEMLTTLEKVLLLKSAQIFGRVDVEDLAPMARVATEQHFAKDEIVFREGEIGDKLYVVIRGHVVIEKGGHILAELGPGESFGEMSVLDEQPRNATVKVVEPTDALAVGSEALYEILQERVEIAEGIIRVLSQRLRAADAARRTEPPPPRTSEAELEDREED